VQLLLAVAVLGPVKTPGTVAAVVAVAVYPTATQFQ